MAYRIERTPAAARELAKLPAHIGSALEVMIKGLGDDPRPHGCKKLQVSGEYRLRHGKYRLRYTVDDHTRLIVITAAGLRDHIYD